MQKSFLKDNKKKLWLISALFDTQINLKRISKVIGAPELRFAQPELLISKLGVMPGSVTTFGIINNLEHDVTVILDKKIFGCDIIGLHPLKNNATVTLTPGDLQKFVNACGNPLIIMDFEAL